eukprot:3368484-Pyramimonas_sp.AAC.1
MAEAHNTQARLALVFQRCLKSNALGDYVAWDTRGSKRTRGLTDYLLETGQWEVINRPLRLRHIIAQRPWVIALPPERARWLRHAG